MEDIYLWHLDFPEEQNWLEAEYISFLIKLAEKKLNTKYKRILDIPCGIGRHHKYLRENGFEVYGIDNNENLIKIAKERNKGFEKYYEVKDMRKINYKEEFDVVLNWFTSFGYFPHEENLLVLRKFYEALKPKGILILDLPVRWREGIWVKEREEYLEIDKSTKIDYKTFELNFKLYKKEGADLKFIKELKLNLIIYPPRELKEMLEVVGFKILFVFKDRSAYDVKEKLDDINEGRLVWVCYK